MELQQKPEDDRRQRPDDPCSISSVDRSGCGIRPDLYLDRSSSGSCSQPWDRWHRSGAGSALQAPLDQSLLDLVHQCRPEPTPTPVKDLIDRKSCQGSCDEPALWLFFMQGTDRGLSDLQCQLPEVRLGSQPLT